MELMEHVAAAGFPHCDRIIHLFVGGSALHGAKLEGTDDLDIYGIYIEPPELILGVDTFEHFVWCSCDQHERNGPNDIDITLYSLRKWAGLAAKGNPTALNFLYAINHAPHIMPWNTDILPYRETFLSRFCIKQFLGFADAQLARMRGERGRGKKGQRPELEQKYGYDVKAGMHVIRLLHEGIELMRTGNITFPRPERDLLIHIRSGGWSMDRLLNEANKLFVECKKAADESKLPENAKRKSISSIIARAYLARWGCAN